jgi:hypothetical protein
MNNRKTITEFLSHAALSIWDHLAPIIKSDVFFIFVRYFIKLGRFPNLRNPKRFTEKLQWLKIHDHNPDYISLVDKSLVKERIRRAIGEEHVIPTIGLWNSTKDIDYGSLPSKFVLKTTHAGGSSGVVICREKQRFNVSQANKQLEKSLKTNTYLVNREWPYKGVEHRVLAEVYLEDNSGDLKDYKFYCFNGEPKVVLIASNRFTTHNFDYFDMDFNALDIVSKDGPKSSYPIDKPAKFEEMKQIATKLCQGFIHVRIDLYCCNNVVYFGEATFYDSSGYDNMNSDKWDLQFGEWLSLPQE